MIESNPSASGAKIGRPRNDFAQRFLGSALDFGVDSLNNDAARMPASGKQHRQINRGRHAAHAVDVA